MSLFSCFDQEEEQLIFETRLHIKDIWLPDTQQWIGQNMMKSLSLYDLLTHGHNIHNQQLLKSGVQNRLFRMMQSVMNGNITTYTSSHYLNRLIKSLMEGS
eukprot:294344_1